MGSGKTTLGKKLSTLLNHPFFDLDSFIEANEERTIPQLFQDLGEMGFRTIESENLRTLLKTKTSSVISLGGGTVCDQSNLNLIKSKGILIFIDVPVKVLADRIRDSKTERPLLQKIRGTELTKFIETKLAERKKYYDQAQIKINGLNIDPHYIREIIGAFLTENVH